MSMRRRGSTRRRLDPDEFFGGDGGANGIPSWENPAAAPIAAKLPAAPRQLPPRSRSSSKSIMSNRSSNSDLGQLRGARPTVSPERKELHPGESMEPHLQNIVIECDYSDMSSDLSGYDDAGTFAEDTGSRGSRRMQHKPSFRPRRPHQQLNVVAPDHHENDYPRHHQQQRHQASSAADIEAEERKLIEMAMERSLQESSSLMSVSYQSHERGAPSATSSASSLLDMQNGLRQHESAGETQDGSRKGVWKRDGKKWAKQPPSSSSASATTQPSTNTSNASAYLEPPMTREERLALMEEQMMHEAMQNSVHGLRVTHDEVSQSSKQRGPSYPKQRRHHHPRDMVDDDIDEFHHDDGYSMSEQAAMERLEELEQERRRIQSAMVRQRSSRGLQSGRSGARPASYRDYNAGGSFRDQDASWDGSDYRSDPHGGRGRRDNYRDSGRQNSRAGGGYRDPVNRRQQYYDQHEISLETLSFRNNEQLDMYEQQQRTAPVRKSPPRTQSYDLMSMNSRDSSEPPEDHRFNQSYANDGGSSHGHGGGRKYVWKRGPNKAWGRYPESEHEEEDEDAIFADVLARSMHER